MSRLVIPLLLICLHAGLTYGMDCKFGSDKNFFDKMFDSCPRPLIDPSENSFCCYDLVNESSYCCSAAEFAKTGLNILIPVAIAVAIVIGLIGCCISCLCCSCCPWYRRRQGTVYGRFQTPTIVQVIQPQSNIPPRINQPAQNYGPHSTGSTEMPQPPPYNEAYVKQAPYNPAFTSQ